METVVIVREIDFAGKPGMMVSTTSNESTPSRSEVGQFCSTLPPSRRMKSLSIKPILNNLPSRSTLCHPFTGGRLANGEPVIMSALIALGFE
jgi:hypothetical protein